MNSSASAGGDRGTELWRSACRSERPSAVEPGSLRNVTGQPARRSDETSRRLWLDFPDPSGPSKVIKKLLFIVFDGQEARCGCLR